MNIKYYKLKAYDATYEVRIRKTKYYNDNLALQLITDEGEPFAVITVNIDKLPEGQACIDTNNCPWAEQFIKENDLGEPTGQYLRSGYCQYPIYNMEVIE